MMMIGDKRKLLTAVLGPHEPDGEVKEDANEVHAIAQELIEAVHNHDVAGVADALKAAFELLDMEPHAEGPHLE